jgi:hypothetical protein
MTRSRKEAALQFSMTLHRWYERECGTDSGCIERDETGKPFWAYYGGKKRTRTAIPDRETGAIRRLTAILATVPHLSYYRQTDPRGASLYIIRPGDVPAGADVCSYYSRGVVVY